MPLPTKAEQSAYQADWMKERREAWIKEHGPCSKCGARHDLVVARVDPEKEARIIPWSLKESKRNAILANCVVLCRDCFNDSRVQHGTRGRYDKGCRCELCRAAKSRYQKALRARLRKRNSRHKTRHSNQVVKRGTH